MFKRKQKFNVSNESPTRFLQQHESNPTCLECHVSIKEPYPSLVGRYGEVIRAPFCTHEHYELFTFSPKYLSAEPLWEAMVSRLRSTHGKTKV